MEMGPWQGVFTRQQPGEEPADLYVLAQPALPGSEEFCGQLVAVVGRLFERQGLSLTGALTKAINAAHENLRDWNRKSLREHQVGAGLTGLVVRENVAYLAQTGPSLAYLRSATGGTRKLLPVDPQASAVLGLAETLRPDMTRIALSPGDVLLIASPVLNDVIDDATVAELLSSDAEQVLSELYLLMRDHPNFSVFLLSCFELEEEEAPAPSPPPAATDTKPPVPIVEEPRVSLRRPASDWQPVEEEEDFIDREFDFSEPLELAPVDMTAGELTSSTVRLRGSQPVMRRQPSAGSIRLSNIVPSWLIGGALIIGLVVLLAWWLIPGSMEGQRQEKFDTLLNGARDSYAAALATGDVAQKRTLLEEADGRLVDAADIQPDNNDLQLLRGNVQGALAAMDALHQLSGVRLVADLKTQLTGDLSLQQMVVGANHAFLLDVKGKRVAALPLNGGKAQEIVHEGDLLGMIEAAKPSQIAWAPDVDGGRLLILDTDRHLFSFRPNEEIKPLGLEDADRWRSADALFFSEGDLYVLDTQGNQVWRYPQIEGGFGPSDPLLADVDLSKSLALAVSGDIYLLGKDGGIRRFSRGQEVSFELEGIDHPLASPTSLIALGDGCLMAVDSGNKRFVVLAPEGAFRGQLVGSQLTNPLVAAVDEVAGLLYVLNGDSLYAADLPAIASGGDSAAGDAQ